MLASASPSAVIPVMFEVARCFLWHSAGVPVGTAYGGATFLFTDIEGSTRWWEEDAQSMRPARDA